MATSGIRHLRPEIQLLYKARPETQEKDDVDFDATEPLLVGPERKWLLESLQQQFPNGHKWIERLR